MKKLIIILIFTTSLLVSFFISYKNNAIEISSQPVNQSQKLDNLEYRDLLIETFFGVQPLINYTEQDKIDLGPPPNTIVIYPIFTQAAYKFGGFYDFFSKECDESCLTVDIDFNRNNTKYTSSKKAIKIFEALKWKIISDIDVENNPGLLEKYDKVVLLHNEYVTRNMFNAITNHSNIIYLYPNALYAEIAYNEQAKSIHLIRGHNYPENHITNGFGWKHDNTWPFEYDNKCISWKFYEIDNGYMLNCYPENIIIQDKNLLKVIKELTK